MNKNNHVEITILEPSRWYLKYTEKNKHYVQLHSSFWGDSTFLALSNDEKVVFLWILSQSLRFNKPTFSVCLEFAYGLLSISLGDSKSILNTLKSNNLIHLEKGLRRQLIKEKKRKENRIEEKKKIISKEIKRSFSEEFINIFSEKEIIEWLKEKGSKFTQEKMLTLYNKDFLKDEVEEAYLWQCENKPRDATSFLTSWCKRSNSPNKANEKTYEQKMKEIDVSEFSTYAKALNCPSRWTSNFDISYSGILPVCV